MLRDVFFSFQIGFIKTAEVFADARAIKLYNPSKLALGETSSASLFVWQDLWYLTLLRCQLVFDHLPKISGESMFSWKGTIDMLKQLKVSVLIEKKPKGKTISFP